MSSSILDNAAVALTTHSADGLTSNDTTLAHRIQRLAGDHHHPPALGLRL